MKTNSRAAVCRIEPLESRIAPSGVFTFNDVDGDLVTVKTSKGTNDPLKALVMPQLAPSGLGGRVENASIYLGYDKFQGGPSADAQVGAVKVSGDWIASSILAGAKNFGTGGVEGGGETPDVSIHIIP